MGVGLRENKESKYFFLSKNRFGLMQLAIILKISLTHYLADKKYLDREAKTLIVSFQLEAKEYPSTELISQSKFHIGQRIPCHQLDRLTL